MFEYSLRLALQTDFPAIRRLIRIGMINPSGLDWNRFTVAVKPEGEVIGCGQIKPHGRGIFELASVAVDPKHRNNGIASAIVVGLMKDAPRPLYLTCRSGLGPFYGKFGFVALSLNEMPVYFQRMSKLAGLVTALARTRETLLVMKLK
jgi:N-acetylglutamate synthase-like GNAT family acetyltransferase